MRKFIFNGMELVDPDKNMAPEQVAEFHSILHAELTNCRIKGPTKDKNGDDIYKFMQEVGHNG